MQNAEPSYEVNTETALSIPENMQKKLLAGNIRSSSENRERGRKRNDTEPTMDDRIQEMNHGAAGPFQKNEGDNHEAYRSNH